MMMQLELSSDLVAKHDIVGAQQGLEGIHVALVRKRHRVAGQPDVEALHGMNDQCQREQQPVLPARRDILKAAHAKSCHLQDS